MFAVDIQDFKKIFIVFINTIQRFPYVRFSSSLHLFNTSHMNLHICLFIPQCQMFQLSIMEVISSFNLVKIYSAIYLPIIYCLHIKMWCPSIQLLLYRCCNLSSVDTYIFLLVILPTLVFITKKKCISNHQNVFA